MGKVKEVVRFTDNKDNTVKDKETRLQWIQDHRAVRGFGKRLKKVKTAKAIAKLNRAKYAGHDDWREPSRMELLTIVDLTRMSPAIDPIFKNTMLDWYRTSTPVANFPPRVWCVGFRGGSVQATLGDIAEYVRPVRSIQ